MNGPKNQNTTDDRKVPQELVEKVKTAPGLEGIPGSTIEKVLSAVPAEQEFFYGEQSSFVGPIPPPEFLSQYKAIDPTYPDRIMHLAENEQRIKEYEIETNYKIRDNEIKAKSKETDLVIKSINLYTRLSSITSLLLILCPFAVASLSIFLGRDPFTGIFMGGLGALPLILKILQVVLIEKDRVDTNINGT